jgi:peroxiredoxin
MKHAICSFFVLSVTLLLSTACGPKAENDVDDNIDDTTDDGVDAPVDDAQPVDYGPESQWFHALEDEVPSDVQGEGFRVGDIAHNFTLFDQNGEEVELYQFYGKTVLLDVFAEWCGPCQAHAPTGESIWQEVESKDVVILAMMQENADRSTSEGPDDPARWADAYGLTHPVLADSGRTAGEFADIGGGYPTYPLIGPDMTIVYQDVFPPSLELLTQVLEDEGIW